MKKLIFALLAWMLTHTAFSQSGNGVWGMYFGNHKVAEKLRLHTEVQLREKELRGSNEQILLRTGLIYRPSFRVKYGGGYGFFANYTTIEEIFEPSLVEHRIWQQFAYTHGSGRFEWEHRFQLEQRFPNEAFHNRLRYRILIHYRFSDDKPKAGTVSLHAYNELFLNLNGGAWDQNRLYGAVGFHLSSNAQVQLGYMRQQIPGFHLNSLQIGLFLSN